MARRRPSYTRKTAEARSHLFNHGSYIRPKPLYQNHVWSYDCFEDRLANGRKIKILTIIDEFTRESLVIRVKRTINSKLIFSPKLKRMIMEGYQPKNLSIRDIITGSVPVLWEEQERWMIR